MIPKKPVQPIAIQFPTQPMQPMQHIQPVPQIQPIQPIKQTPTIFNKNIMYYHDKYLEDNNKDMYLKVTIPQRKDDYPNEKGSFDIDVFLQELHDYDYQKTIENGDLDIDDFVKDDDTSESECEYKCSFNYIQYDFIQSSVPMDM